eukprot:TRINITY_DN16712_c0_g1_i1.p1 TRINITY_DN16712_c0_g1~~TRINITY_DN16712_c0_g1_i1.p1  ORF type:complete len:211 (+),score=37.12 TRINITY_DN16712_c0_g1_i1:66-698(+)
MEPLRLPDLIIQRAPDEDELRFVARLKVACDEQDDCWPPARSRTSCEPSEKRTRRSTGDLHGAGRRASAGLSAGRASLDDLFGASPKRSGRSGYRNARGARPTLRQPIDDTTSVPADVFERMMQLGSEARARASHRKAFRPETGEPYLAHDARPLAEHPAGEGSAAAAAASLPIELRPHSACATEAAMEGCERWGTSESAASIVMPLQVF